MARNTMKQLNDEKLRAEHGELIESIAEILRTARVNGYRAVNFIMVEAYWNVGRMIVEEEQQGKERAEYGEQIIRLLSVRLKEEFGKGFTEANLWNFVSFSLLSHCLTPTIKNSTHCVEN